MHASACVSKVSWKNLALARSKGGRSHQRCVAPEPSLSSRVLRPGMVGTHARLRLEAGASPGSIVRAGQGLGVLDGAGGGAIRVLLQEWADLQAFPCRGMEPTVHLELQVVIHEVRQDVVPPFAVPAEHVRGGNLDEQAAARSAACTGR